MTPPAHPSVGPELQASGFRLEAIESHFALCDPSLLSLARLLFVARQKMKGPLGLVADDQPVWLDTERISRMDRGATWDRLDQIEALLAELVRLDIVRVERKLFVGAEEVRSSFGFVFRPTTAWQPAIRDPRREPRVGDRFRSPSLSNCGRVVTSIHGDFQVVPDSFRARTVSYCQVSKDGGVKQQREVTVHRAEWDAYVDRMMVAS